MLALGKFPSAKLSVRAPAVARPWAAVRSHRLSFLLNTMATDVAADCVLDMAYAIVQIVNFLYYWQATEPARAGPEPGLTPLAARGES